MKEASPLYTSPMRRAEALPQRKLFLAPLLLFLVPDVLPDLPFVQAHRADTISA